MSDETRTWAVTLRIPEEASLDCAGETRTIDVSEDESILWAARNEGLWLPADCQQGWCVTCAARIVEGEVDQSNARRYYDEDHEAEFVLVCVAKPRSDVTLEVCKYDEMLEHRADFDLPPGRSKIDS